MKKVISLLCAGALASASVLTPISTAPAKADDYTTTRFYVSIPLGSGERVKERPKLGFQLQRSWQKDDAAVFFPEYRNLTVFDFAMSADGLAKADVLGLDTIKAYDIWNENKSYSFGNLGSLTSEQRFLLLAVGGGLLIGCLVEWCDDDDNNNRPPPPSDARLKQDIAHIATLESGIKIYSFRYLWDETVRVWVMAQDLLMHATRRQAVIMMPNGFYAVSYTMLGLKMATLKAWQEQGQSAVLLRPALAKVSTLSAALPQ